MILREDGKTNFWFEVVDGIFFSSFIYFFKLVTNGRKFLKVIILFKTNYNHVCLILWWQ